MNRPTLRIARAENDLLFDDEGRSYLDLFTAHGTTFLGHADPDVAAAVARQLGRVWIAGGLETEALVEAKRRIDGFFPDSHTTVALYSTGMEAAEFAMRLARVHTGKPGVLGFDRDMHGKSMATAFLGWDNRDGVRLPEFVRLPSPPDRPELEILAALDDALATRAISAVFVEPIRGCDGARRGSDLYYHQVAELCRARGSLLVFDEILSGFFRTGRPFVFSGLGFVPDVILVGKAMGNGFPVSGVVARRDLVATPAMLPGSTFSGNPLAASAVSATLAKLASPDLPGRVEAIGRTIADGLAPLADLGVVLRGVGAFWALELPSAWNPEAVVVELYRNGLAVGVAGRYLRLLPASTIDPGRLDSACSTIVGVIERVSHEHR